MSVFDDPLLLLIRRVDEVERRLKSALSALHSPYPVLNENTPTSIAATPQNDYVIGDYASLRLGGIAVNFTGFTGGKKGRVLKVMNVGANNLNLQHENVGSAAANRFLTSTGATITLGANDSAELYYDSTTLRWRVVSFTQ